MRKKTYSPTSANMEETKPTPHIAGVTCTGIDMSVTPLGYTPLALPDDIY